LGGKNAKVTGEDVVRAGEIEVDEFMFDVEGCPESGPF